MYDLQWYKNSQYRSLNIPQDAVTVFLSDSRDRLLEKILEKSRGELERELQCTVDENKIFFAIGRPK